MEDHAHLGRLARALILVRAALLLSLAVALISAFAFTTVAAASTPAFKAPSQEANQSGRLDTTSLYNLGNRTSALYAFPSNGSKFSKKLFWKSAKGKFNAARAKLASGDLNNDGNADALVLYDLGKGRSALYAFLSNGSEYTKTTAWKGSLNWSRAKLCIADVNGDGAEDAYVLYQTSTTKSSVYTFTSSSTAGENGSPARVKMKRSTALKATSYRWSRAQIAATDVNADGKDELVSLYRRSKTKARLDVFTLSGATLKRSSFWSGSLRAASARLACGDVDSDGKGDVVLLSDSGRRGSALRVLRSTGSKLLAPKTWWKSGAGKLDWRKTALALGDVTSDGKADAVLLSQTSTKKSKLTVGVSNGTGFAASRFWSGTLRYPRARLACAPATAIVIPATTEVLPAATLETAASSDGSTYTFADPAHTATLAPGDVMVGAPTAALPQGVFGKVTSVEGSVVSTEPATLEDLISEGEFSADHAITESDFINSATSIPGVKLVRSRATGKDSRLITLRLTDVNLSKEWTLDAELAPVTVSGTITMSISIHVAGEVGFGAWGVPEVKHFEVIETSTIASDLSASIGGEKSFSDEKTLITWGAGKISGFTVWVGPVPLYFQPELSIFVGAEGEFAAGVSTSIHYDAKGKLGVIYDGKDFRRVSGFKTTRSYSPPSVSASGSVKAYGGTKLGLNLYAAAGPYVRMDGYLKLAADTNATPWWTLKCGVEGSVGAAIGIHAAMIDWDVDWHTKNHIFAEWTLAEASSPPTQGSIAGRVLDGDGAALPGVAVNLSGAGSGSTTTAADGAYSFAGLSPGTYTLDFAKTGYAGGQRSGLVVRAGQTTTVPDVRLSVNVTPTPTPPPSGLAIGQAYGGGIVAYIDGTGVHGLISAAADQMAYPPGIQWATEPNWYTSVSGALGTAIGTGAANTDAIIAQNGAGSSYAAGLARAYTGGGYSDWFLPSKDELRQLYVNRVAIGGFDTTPHSSGGWPWYWSSSQYADYAYLAWNQYFGGGNQNDYGNKGSTARVRAVRAF